MAHVLRFVKRSKEHGDTYTFYFSAPKGVQFKAGQHGVFILPGLYRPHPFSVSSAPEEEYLTITTHVNTGSRYKKRLMTLKPEDRMYLLGPMLWFTFKKRSAEHIFLAQGVGITPFRSMLAHSEITGDSREITLIHVDAGQHTFKAQTSRYATHSFYPKSAEEFRKRVRVQDSNAHFYISGSPRFNRQTKRLLRSQGIRRTRIKTDAFFGY